jgi:hypothetical protein
VSRGHITLEARERSESSSFSETLALKSDINSNITSSYKENTLPRPDTENRHLDPDIGNVITANTENIRSSSYSHKSTVKSPPLTASTMELPVHAGGVFDLLVKQSRDRAKSLSELGPCVPSKTLIVAATFTGKL